jgi:nicotinamide-nucleotide amidase
MERIGILITGSEILAGKIRDTNGEFFSRSLKSRGVEPQLCVVCGDAHEDIKNSIQFLLSQCDSVVVTGGLGPTTDDLTAQAVASVFGRELVFSPDAWDVCESYFKRQGRVEIPESNRKQAMLPLGARILNNPRGTAAGFFVRDVIDGCDVRVFCLPGVPSEMEPMFEGFVLPELVGGSVQRLSRTWKIFSHGESFIQQKLIDLENDVRSRFLNCDVSYQASQGLVSWSISAPIVSSENENFLNFLENKVDAVLRSTLGAYVLSVGEKSLSEFLIGELSRKDISIATAESCTGGLIAHRITSVPGASRVFLGSAVTYSNESKADLLGVDMRLIERYGAVSCDVAGAMASGARAAFVSDLAVSTTGVAGPGGGTAAHPVGTVCFGLSLVASRVSHYERLIRRMKELEWNICSDQGLDSGGQVRTMEFVAERRFGSALSREAIQQRALAFCLGSIIAITEDLI